MIDNFNLICGYLPQEPVEDLVYQVMVLVRKKDHPHLTHKNNTQRIIYSCIVRCAEGLREKESLLKQISEIGQARVMITIMPKHLREMCWNVQRTNLEYLSSNQFATKAFRIADTCLGSMKPAKEHRLFLWDIDAKEDLEPFVETLKDSGAEVVLTVPTRSGYHVHTKPFNYVTPNIKEELKLDMHKNNPTLLYLPNSLSEGTIPMYALIRDYPNQPYEILTLSEDQTTLNNWAKQLNDELSKLRKGPFHTYRVLYTNKVLDIRNIPQQFIDEV